MRDQPLCVRHLPDKAEWHEPRRAWADEVGLCIDYLQTWDEARVRARELHPEAKRYHATNAYLFLDHRDPDLNIRFRQACPEVRWGVVMRENLSQNVHELLPAGGRFFRVMRHFYMFNPAATSNRLKRDPFREGLTDLTLHDAWARTIGNAAWELGYEGVVIDYNGIRGSRYYTVDVPWCWRFSRNVQELQKTGVLVLGNGNGPSGFMPSSFFDGFVMEDAIEKRAEIGQRRSGVREERIWQNLGPLVSMDDNGGEWREGVLTTVATKFPSPSVFVWNPDENRLLHQSWLARELRFALGLWIWIRTMQDHGPYLSIDRTYQDRTPDLNPFEIINDLDLWLSVKVDGVRVRRHGGMLTRKVLGPDGTRYRLRINPTAKKLRNVDPFDAQLAKL